MELVRTKDILTAGITNIPLAKPAFIYFNFDNNDNDSINTCYSMFESMGIAFIRSDNIYNNTVKFQSHSMIDSSRIKLIFRNFRTLRPKLLTDWRYLFWEIDTRDNDLLEQVLDVYKYFELPVYVHKSARGYHFLSIKPIEKKIFQYAIQQLRRLGTLEQISPALKSFYENDKYPPITLRIKPNKYYHEDTFFNDGFIVSAKLHTDTFQLRNWIIYQNFDKIREHYQLVWYSLDKEKKEIVQ